MPVFNIDDWSTPLGMLTAPAAARTPLVGSPQQEEF